MTSVHWRFRMPYRPDCPRHVNRRSSPRLLLWSVHRACGIFLSECPPLPVVSVLSFDGDACRITNSAILAGQVRPRLFDGTRIPATVKLCQAASQLPCMRCERIVQRSHRLGRLVADIADTVQTTAKIFFVISSYLPVKQATGHFHSLR